MTAGRRDDLGPVSLAQTAAERHAVYRLRYEAYVRELRKGSLSNVDHRAGLLHDPEDDQEGVSILYTGTAVAMTGSVRLQVWEPGQVPEKIYERYSLDLFHGIEAFPVAEVGRLVIRQDVRGGRLLSALASAAFQYGTAHREAAICFLYCSPGLVRAYMRLGCRPYPGFVIPNADGIRLPMFITSADVIQLHAIASRPAPRTGFQPARDRATPEMARMLEEVAALPYHYETDPEQIWQEVRDCLQPGPQPCSRLLDGVSAEEARLLCEHGFVMEIPAEKVVMREGLVERDLYLVLQGRYQVQIGDTAIIVLAEGDVLGEVSFFQNPGERVATIRSLTPGRVMVLERHFVERLIPTHPELACRLLLNLGRILSSHLAMALRAYIGEQ